jgi:hypothetical protein
VLAEILSAEHPRTRDRTPRSLMTVCLNAEGAWMATIPIL